MILNDQYDGSTDPFEGDRTILWRSLPSNAKVNKAIVSITPVAASGTIPFEEVITFSNGQGGLGATKNATSGFVEVDFHKRRTLAGVDGPGIRSTTTPPNGATLQVDLGGLYVQINDQGAIRVPNDNLFHVPSDGSLPGLTVSKFKLTPTGTNFDVTSVVIRSVPTNVTVRVGTLAPIFSRVGELPAAASSPDFSAILQTFLAQAEVVNGFYAIPLVIHSDTVARLRLELNLDFVGQASLQPVGLKEVLVPFDFNTLPKTAPNVISVSLPPNARVLSGQTSAKVAGAFQDTRIADGIPPGSPPSPFVVHVSPAESQAQLIAPNIALSVVAIDLLLSAARPFAQLNLDLRHDQDGKPDGVSVLSKPVPVTVIGSAAQEPSWVSVRLPSEFTFAKEAKYWLVLSSLEGEAAWSIQPGAPGSIGIQHTLDGGLSWHYAGSLGASGPLDASFRLRNKPPVFQVPVQLQVGSGNQSVPVSLDRFQPLGKVDFTIDTADFSDAFNQYLSAGAPSACPQGEHLSNGSFDAWAVSGNQVGATFQLDLSGNSSALATSSDGRWTYAAGTLESDEHAAVLVIDSVCDEPLPDAIALEPHNDDPRGIAVNPAGDRLYVAGTRNLWLVDAAARTQLGNSISAMSVAALLGPVVTYTGPAFPGQIAVSSDGALVYLTLITTSLSVLSVSSTALDEAARGLRPLRADDVRSLTLAANAPAATAVAAMALSPDGTRLVLAMNPSTTVSVIDATSFRFAGAGVDVQDQPAALDFTPDGKLVLVPTSGKDTRLHLVDAATETDVAVIVLGADPPKAVAVSPDGLRAYVLLDGTVGSVLPVDLKQQQPGTAVALATSPLTMAITPQGDHLYVAFSSTELTVVPIGERTPLDWFVTSGTPTVPARVLPLCLGGVPPFDLVLVIAQSRSFQPNTVAAGLSQVVPVSGPCSYEFSFNGYSDDSGALAEIFWLDAKSTLLRTDTIPIPVQPGISSGDAALAISQTTQAIRLLLQRVRLTSPAGAAQAEVRFSAPPFAVVVLASVSLDGTPEVLQNGDLQLVQNGLPAGWTLNAQYARGVSLNAVNGATRLLNSSAGSAELTQTAAIGASQQYAWELEGRPVKLGLSALLPSAELRWLKADGSAAGPPTSLPLDFNSLLRYPANGTTPAGSASVEIHLQTPPGSGLDIFDASLQTPQPNLVPLTFVSHSPGELRVSRSIVTYDVVPVPPPPVPSQGLATPTPPGSKPGEPPTSCFCSCCGTEQPMTQPQTMTTPSGRPVTVGSCSTCGSTLVRPGGPLVMGATVLLPRTLPQHGPGVARRLVRRRPAPLPPLTALEGIGEGRAGQLAEIGITSLEHLANASPEDVAKALRASPKHASGFIQKAKDLIASHRGSPPAPAATPAPPQPPADEPKKEN
jgi:DNA-binding beta-propeller fold protein YncE